MLLAPALVAAPTSLLNPLRRSVSTTAVASASLNLSQNMAVAHGPLVSTVEDGRTLARDVEPLLVSRSAGSLAPRVGGQCPDWSVLIPGLPPDRESGLGPLFGTPNASPRRNGPVSELQACPIPVAGPTDCNLITWCRASQGPVSAGSWTTDPMWSPWAAIAGEMGGRE